jgi:hypothetical protein
MSAYTTCQFCLFTMELWEYEAHLIECRERYSTILAMLKIEKAVDDAWERNR